MGEAPAFGNREDFFQNTWLDGNFPIRVWNVYSMEGARTNNNTEGWHSKLRKLAGKAHPNIYEAVTLSKSEQAATEVIIMQLAAGGLSTRRRRKYKLHEKRLATIKKKYEAGDNMLSEFLKAHCH